MHYGRGKRRRRTAEGGTEVRRDVYDIDQDKIGSVDATYVNESNQREYIAVSGGLSSLLPGTSWSHLIPADLCTINNN
jgi:hypothetical protein